MPTKTGWNSLQQPVTLRLRAGRKRERRVTASCSLPAGADEDLSRPWGMPSVLSLLRSPANLSHSHGHFTLPCPNPWGQQSQR